MYSGNGSWSLSWNLESHVSIWAATGKNLGHCFLGGGSFLTRNGCVLTSDGPGKEILGIYNRDRSPAAFNLLVSRIVQIHVLWWKRYDELVQHLDGRRYVDILLFFVCWAWVFHTYYDHVEIRFLSAESRAAESQVCYIGRTNLKDAPVLAYSAPLWREARRPSYRADDGFAKRWMLRQTTGLWTMMEARA